MEKLERGHTIIIQLEVRARKLEVRASQQERGQNGRALFVPYATLGTRRMDHDFDDKKTKSIKF